jgi:glycosyltransferase involved in cell wall biosynthesis
VRILTQAFTLERVGGIEVNTLEVSRALAARGHDVHVVHGPPLLGPSTPNMRADFEAAGITLHGPQPFLSPSPVTALPILTTAWPTASLAAKLRPDVVWLQRFEHIVWGQLSARRSGAPLVAHLHHALTSRRITPVIARGVDQFIAVSDFMRRHWIDDGLDPDRIAVVHNAVPAEQYPAGGDAEMQRARQQLGLPADARTALFYGRLEAAKGLAMALDAWQLAGDQLASAHLVLAGDFPPGEDADLRRRVTDLVAAGRATLLPPQRDVVPLLHAADLVLFPSQLPESFGRVALEGLMSGRPVLATDVGGVPEILCGPFSDFLVPRSDAQALSARLVQLLDWRRDTPDLGARCAREATARFGWDAHVDRIEQLLTDAGRSRRTR